MRSKEENHLTSELKNKWPKILKFVEDNFGKKPDLNALLFLIGIRELGIVPTEKFKKDEKTHLMHIANCKILSYSGYYKQTGFDELGWPVWENIVPIPKLSLFEQENLLKHHIITYFETEEIINFTNEE